MSSFTEATFEKVVLANGKPKLRNGRQVYAIRGSNGNGFYYDIGKLGSGLRVHVPEGFETDGPSAPALILWAMPTKHMVKSAAIHDMLREDLSFTLLECDVIFLAAMEAEKTPVVWRELAFAAVRTNTSRTKHNALV